MSIGTPSTTTSGWALALSEFKPRINMAEPMPGAPERLMVRTSPPSCSLMRSSTEICVVVLSVFTLAAPPSCVPLVYISLNLSLSMLAVI